MRVYLIWFGVICCGAMNGYFCEDFQYPGNLILMLCSSIVCAIILLIHRRITKDWVTSASESSSLDEDYNFPIFGFSAVVNFVAFFLFLPSAESNGFEIAASITVAVASLIAFLREREYANFL